MERTEIKIREAKIDDLNTLELFEQSVIQYERPFAPNLKEDPIQYYDLLNLIERKDAHLIVATTNGEIIGSGYALIKNSEPYKKPEKYAYLGFMYVSPKFRGKGINGKIIDSLTDWAKQRDLEELQLDVYAKNEIAINAYKKRNFKPDLLKMRLNLNQ
ncbi:GNAT family N-acetyltransferase [Tenacibaculum sp. C7A-26P2]|uniref:GNAT family N-acetyltransferase n=1 Tax=Tenacibaculum sp. C7A-26P2 TaxID=3447504 RepID=UPI003F83D742